MPRVTPWLKIATRKGGVISITTPYAMTIGAFGLIAVITHNVWGWTVSDQVHDHVLLFLAFLLFSIISSAAQVYRDGRQHLGAITNGLLDLARQIVSFIADKEAQGSLKSKLILFGVSCRDDLRGKDRRSNPLVILAGISCQLTSLQTKGELLIDYRFAMESSLTALTNGLGACRRVQKAQLPADYTILGEMSLLLFALTLPFVMVEEIGFWVVPVMTGVGYLLVGLLQLAKQSWDPYGDDANDLNMGEFERALTVGVEAIFTVDTTHTHTEV